MDEKGWLAAKFEENRPHLRAVAFRMLGSRSEAEDAVQEAWIRLARAEAGELKNLGGWLTTVVGRVCLDMLRSRKSRREDPLDLAAHDVPAGQQEGMHPEHEAELADSVGLALLVVLETLAPDERIAFVLHDMFSVPFEEIAPIVGRTPEAARQLASRARRRVQGAPKTPEPDLGRQREVVQAFLAASRAGNFEALMAILDPDVVLHVDPAALAGARAREAQGAPHFEPQMRGAKTVGETFLGRARAARPALVGGAMGAAWAPDGQPRAVFAFGIRDGKITSIEVIADPARIAGLGVQLLEG
ncbi:MAG TPA: sigma-70 family RNA polymerase sigma factor [Gammaproteobacteria bacterium]|nr:sigma-70 family RNA polymerase sigma factor [Gammaproteobacteria bacterium]